MMSVLYLSLSSCKNEEPKERPNFNWDTNSKSEFRASQSHLSSSRYLGRGFNVISNELFDVDGFTKYNVIDLNKNFKNSNDKPLVPEVIIEDIKHSEPTREYHLSLDKTTKTNTISFSPSASYKKVSITFTKKNSEINEQVSNAYYSSVSQPLKEISFDTEYPEDFSDFLSEKFERDLNRLRPKALIKRYGTHIVISYVTGAYMRLWVTTNSSVFSKEDTKKIELKLWNNNVKIPYEIQNKIKQNLTDIAIIYKQGGSSYTPNKSLLSVNNLFSKNVSIEELSERDFISGIRYDDNTFLRIKSNGLGLISIPDLITDVPLKVKYASGILHEVYSNGINYVLCDPKGMLPILKNKEHLYINLPDYSDYQAYIINGLGSTELLEDSLWNAHLHPDGLWTFSNLDNGKYLCRDLKYRDREEDKLNLRFWLLNPIMPSDSGNLFNIHNLFIQPNM